MKLIILDSETGGLDADVHSILSLGATVWPPDPRITFEYFVREEPYHLTAGALAVNHIDIVAHHAAAHEPASVWAAFLSFCAAQADVFKVAGRYVLGGHNVPFDLRFLKRLHRLSGDARPFEDTFSHRFVDTMAIGTALLLAGGLPGKQAMGLGALCAAFGVEPTAAHTALGDALTTAQLLDKMLLRMGAGVTG